MKNKKKKEIKIKKIQIKKPNPTFPASTLQRIRFFKKAALMSALQTYSKVSTESFIFRYSCWRSYLPSRKSRSPGPPWFTLRCHGRGRETTFSSSL